MASEVPTQSGAVCLWLQLMCGKNHMGVGKTSQPFLLLGLVGKTDGWFWLFLQNLLLHPLSPVTFTQQTRSSRRVKCMFIGLVKRNGQSVTSTVLRKLCKADVVEQSVKALFQSGNFSLVSYLNSL